MNTLDRIKDLAQSKGMTIAELERRAMLVMELFVIGLKVCPLPINSKELPEL